MRAIFSSLTVLFILGCSTGGRLVYDFELTHPVQSNELFYENDTMSISFDIKPDWIQFELYNKLNDGIKISWDEVSLSYNGEAYRVVHKETGVLSVNVVQPPTTIPPRTKLKDALIRTDKIKQKVAFAYQPASVYIENTFPVIFYNKKERDKALKEKGLKMTLFMPFYIGGKYVSKYYDIFLRDITVSKN